MSDLVLSTLNLAGHSASVAHHTHHTHHRELHYDVSWCERLEGGQEGLFLPIPPDFGLLPSLAEIILIGAAATAATAIALWQLVSLGGHHNDDLHCHYCYFGYYHWLTDCSQVEPVFRGRRSLHQAGCQFGAVDADSRPWRRRCP